MKVASFFKRLDEMPLGGQELNPAFWPWNSSRLRQDLVERGDPQNRWARGTDHTDRRGRGIAENRKVQDEVLGTVLEGLIADL